MIVVFLGPPGVGKGTQAQKLSESRAIPKISTGDILREAVARKTPLGVKAKGYMDAGKLVPDDVVVGMVVERIKSPDCEPGFILDGFPRNVAQAEALNRAFGENGRRLDRVVSFDLSDEKIVERLSSRRNCPKCQAVYNLIYNPPKESGVCDQCGSPLVQRSDDEPQTIRKRLGVYRQETLPLVPYYESRSLLTRIEAEGEVGDVFQRVTTAVGE
jgi:adenylate kinase